MKAEIRELLEAMGREGYVADEAIATAAFLAADLKKPLLIEGDAGVGKTEIAKVLASVYRTELVRLQCYEGLDVATSLYEWNYPRQLLRVRLAELDGQGPAKAEEVIFGRDYLLERPLLRAITRKQGPAVLLIDEVDRADEAFEAFLLELLSDFQVTIPELGTVRAEHVPHVLLTSNCTRELSDALRRRCLYLHVDHPALDKEVRILRSRVPAAGEQLAVEIGRFVQALRARRLVRTPGVAESIDWARALVRLHADHLELAEVEATLGCLIKDRHDQRELKQSELGGLVAAAHTGEARA
jgi:MoxR-like ATPase